MCFGPFKRLCHWGPLTAIGNFILNATQLFWNNIVSGIVKLVTGATIHCSGMWWPASSLGGFLNTLCFMSLSGLTLFHLLSAMFHGPGYLPLGWKPVRV